MTPKPTRSTIEGRAYLDLRAKARADNRSTEEILRFYALEGFLDRLATSKRSAAFVLKGGVLLVAYDLRRPTRDVDLLAENTSNDATTILMAIKEIIAESKNDGLVFGEPTAQIIREDAQYSGVRVTIPCSLSTAQIDFSVDVNVGDPISPPPVAVKITRLLGGEIALRGYPLAMILAEKIVTAMQRGSTNTRWRDFADVYLLTSHHAVAADVLLKSIGQVAKYRSTEVGPLATLLGDLEAKGQAKWSRWRRSEQLDHRLPASLAEVLTAIRSFADPLVGGRVTGLAWKPSERSWM